MKLIRGRRWCQARVYLADDTLSFDNCYSGGSAYSTSDVVVHLGPVEHGAEPLGQLVEAFVAVVVVESSHLVVAFAGGDNYAVAATY